MKKHFFKTLFLIAAVLAIGTRMSAVIDPPAADPLAEVQGSETFAATAAYSDAQVDESLASPYIQVDDATDNGDLISYNLIAWNNTKRTLKLHYTNGVHDDMPDLDSEAWVHDYMDLPGGNGRGTTICVAPDEWGNVYAYFTYTDETTGNVYRSPVSSKVLNKPATETLPLPGVNYWMNGDMVMVNFNTYLYVNDESVTVTVHYSIDGGEWQTYGSGKEESVQVPVGSTLSFYGSAMGYLDSPTATYTVTAPLWSTMEEKWYMTFYTDGQENVITLGAESTEPGLYPLLAGDYVLDERLLTANENLSDDFKTGSYGLYNPVERTYALTDVVEGDVVTVSTFAHALEQGGKEPEAPQSRREARKNRPSHVVAPGSTCYVTAVDGLELDTWNSDDSEGQPWKYYAFRAKKSGTVKFRVAADCSMDYISVMGERPPYMPSYDMTGFSGANRTFRIWRPDNATTLYYTTAVADEQPAPDSGAWSSTTDSYVDVTVSGVGYIYFYATNKAGSSDVVSLWVNGVELKLNAPYISRKSYNQSTDLWTVSLYSDQSSVEGYPQATIRYNIDGGAKTTYTDPFTMPNGAQLAFWAEAEGYAASDTTTVTSQSMPNLTFAGQDNFYYITSGTVGLGTEVVSGLYRIAVNGADQCAYVLTPNENMNANFRAVRYSGIYSGDDRVYAVSGRSEGEYLAVEHRYGTLTALDNCEADLWNSTFDTYRNIYLKVTADGTVSFKLSGGSYLTSVSLYKEPQDGTVEVADANGNVLTYYYDNATSPATLTGISRYSDDEAKAGRIIIADEVTDRKGNVHQVKYVGASLDNRSNLVSVVFGQHITAVGGRKGGSGQSFYGCQKLESVTLNAKVDTLGASSFYNCTALRSISLDVATGLKSIGNYCFEYSAIEELTIPESVEQIGSNIIYGCNALKTITFNAPTIRNSFCSNVESLTTINIGKNVKSIGEYAFQSCTKATVLNIDAGVADLEIGRYAFAYIDSLRTVSLPAGVKSLGEYCFNSCDSLRTVAFAEGTTLSTLPNYCFSGSGLQTISIPGSVTTLGQYCFDSCRRLTSVEFDDDCAITAIPTGCFQYATALETLTLPNAVETVANYAFRGMTALREITFGTGLATNAFYNSYYVFYSCSNVQKMTIPGINFPFQCNMSSLPNTMQLFVHPDMVSTYKASDYTKRFHIIATGSQTDFDIATTDGGQLATKIPAEIAGNVLRLKISGPINGTDINQMHELMPFLEELDLKQASIVEGGEDYYRYNFNTSSNVATKENSYHWPTKNDTIGQYMFYNMPNLRTFIMPDGVKTIEQYGVGSSGTSTTYTKLAYAELPSSLETIAQRAFYNQRQMKTAALPAGVTTIGEYAFYQAGITEAVVPSGVTAIERSAFSSCADLKTVTLPDAITTIGQEAFYSCSALESVNIPQNVVTIGSYAFAYCYKLCSPLEFPATLTTIGSDAFYSCNVLTSVTFSEGLQTIGGSAFNSCYRLREAQLPQSLTSLGSYAFAYADSLTTFTLPHAITEVPSGVVCNSDALQSVTLAEGTTKIGSEAFSGCPMLTTVNKLNQSTLTSVEYSAFANTGLTTVTLPESVTNMGSSVFQNCTELQSANIPTLVTTVPESTFSGCSKLASVAMPAAITSVGNYAFSGCTLLPSVTLGDQVTTIGYSAFRGCKNLVMPTLPASLTTIGSYAFQNTTKLADALTLPETLTTLDHYAFYQSGIRSVVITKPLNSFGDYVFSNCDSLVSASLPKEMTVLPYGTFQYTPRLKTVILPDSLKTIRDNAFYASGLETIALPQKLQTIGYQAFSESQLREIDLPLKLQTIGSYAFYNTQLREIRVPKNVTSVGGYVAAYCKNLKTAYLGRKQNYASNSNFDYFAGCDSLELLRVYAGTPPSISNYQYAVWTSSGWRSYASYRTNCVLEVPDGQVDIYQATDIWKEFKQIRAFESEEWLNQADFAALQKLYNLADGPNWTKTWNMESRRHANGKWQGVSTVVDEEDDELFYVTAISLADNGLSGQLPKELFQLERMTQLDLSHNALETKVDTLLDAENTVLTTLNMEGNHLRGDLYPLVSKLPGLTDLNVSYNWLTAYSEATPNTTLTNSHMYRGFQFVDWQTKQVCVPDDLLDEVVTDYTPGTPVDIASNTLQTYRHEYGDWGLTIGYLYRLYKSGSSLNTTSEGALRKNGALWDANTGSLFKAEKGQLVAYASTDPWWSYITHILRIDWENGDINGDQTVDVADVQNAVFYALNDTRPGGSQLYNFSAADLNSDNRINVQDIVGTVGLALAYTEPDEPAADGARPFMAPAADARNTVTANGTQLLLTNTDAVAALQLTVSGATTATVSVPQQLKSLFSVSMKNVGDGVRIVLYSPQGNSLAPGQHQLLSQMPAGAEVSDVRLVDTEAQRLSVSIGGETTAIETIDTSAITDDTPVYNLAGHRVGRWQTLPAGVYIVSWGGKQFKVKK